MKMKEIGRAVGIELLFNSTKSRVFTVLPTASQMNWSQMELSNTKHREIAGEKRLGLEGKWLNFATNLVTCRLAPTKFCSAIFVVRHPVLSIREVAYKPLHA